MAKQTGLFKFTGKLDNVIGYRRNGVHFVRSMPEKVQQTAATKRAARNFGIISRKGKLIRKALIPYLEMRYDGTIVNRLNKALLQAGKNNLQCLERFRFNRHTGIEKMFLADPVLREDGTLHIPAQELLPQGTNTHLEVRLIAARIDFATQRVIATDADTTIIDLNEPFNGVELSVDLSGKGTLLIALQCRACIECNGELSPSGNRRYMAADLLRVIVPAAPVQKLTRKKGVWKRPAYLEPVKRIANRKGNMLPPVFRYQLE
jgi:hypothetical protein